MAEKPKSKNKHSDPPAKPASKAIEEIESLVETRVIVYNSQRSLAFWDIPPFYSLLSKMGHQEKLSIILQSHGGYSEDAFKIANIIHEFADEVTFIVPYYANSAATLLCLSGNQILMGPISELGPTNPMMPVDERLIMPTIPLPTESEAGAKEKAPPKRQMAAHALRDFLTVAGILRSDGLSYDPEVLSVYMAKGILNPFLLGDFERAIKTSVQYAETLLRNYMFKGREGIVPLSQETALRLCEGYYDHKYPINRKEAREALHLNVKDMSDDLWQQSSELMQAYDKLMDPQNISTIIETSDMFQIAHWASPS